MTIGSGNDHHGVDVKKRIIEHLKERNIDYIDYGTNTKDNVDYIKYARIVCNAILNKECDLGILICGTGIGMSIVANKFDGIRCGKVNTVEEAKLTKEHNMSNVMALSEKISNLDEVLDAFIDTKYSNEERHIRRVEEIMEVEQNG